MRTTWKWQRKNDQFSEKKKTINKFIDIDKNESPCGIRTRDLQIDTPNQYLTQC